MANFDDNIAQTPFVLGLFAPYGVFGNCCCVAVLLFLEGILVLWARNPA